MNFARVHSLLRALRSRRSSIAHIRCVYDNLGDILVADAIHEMLTGANMFSCTLSKGIRVLDRTIGIQRAFKYSCLGGGTLILAPYGVGWLEAVTYFAERTTPLCTFGTGVIDPVFRAHIASLNPQCFQIDSQTTDLWSECLSRFRYISVRGCESKRVLSEMGLERVEIIGDPALYYSRDSISPKQRGKRIGINVSRTSDFWGNSQEHVAAEFHSILKSLHQHGWKVTLFPTEAVDAELARAICKNGLSAIEICDVYCRPADYMARVAEQDVFLGTKLHSVISAFCSYTPAIMVGYQPKCYDFMKTMGFERFFVRSDQVDAEQVISLIGEMYADIETIQKEQHAACQAFRTKQLAFAAKVLASIGISPDEKS